MSDKVANVVNWDLNWGFFRFYSLQKDVRLVGKFKVVKRSNIRG